MNKALALIGAGLGALGVILLVRRPKAVPPPPLPGYANLYGKVTNAVTGKAISGALVAVDNTTTFTDSNGNYILANIPVGAYTAIFTKDGYETAVF